MTDETRLRVLERWQDIAARRFRHIEHRARNSNTSDPPTSAELDLAFGTRAVCGEGFIGFLDDNGAGTAVWLCAVVNNAWRIVEVGAGIVGVHDHSVPAQGGQFDAGNLYATGTQLGQVLRSDGGGNADWAYLTHLDRVTDGAVNVTPDALDCLIVCNRAGAQSVLLPASTGAGRYFIIKVLGIGPVTVTPNGADTIDGGGAVVLATYEAIQLVDYTAGGWVIV